VPFGAIPVAAVVAVGVGSLDQIGEPGAGVPAEQGHGCDQQAALRVVGGCLYALGGLSCLDKDRLIVAADVDSGIGGLRGVTSQ
jgi:hypothetical protein